MLVELRIEAVAVQVAVERAPGRVQVVSAVAGRLLEEPAQLVEPALGGAQVSRSRG